MEQGVCDAKDPYRTCLWSTQGSFWLLARHTRTGHQNSSARESLLVLHNILLDFGDVTEDLGPQDAAEVLRQKHLHRIQEEDFIPTVPEARTRNHVRELGLERRRQLVDYWLQAGN